MKRFAIYFLTILALATGSCFAQSKYPSKPVRFVVGYPAGGIADTIARTLAQKMTEGWGQQVYVDNRPGAAGAIGANIVAKSPADGYTILITAPASQAVVSILNAPLPYDAERDFWPVAKTADIALVLVVNPSVPAKTAKELITFAKAHPTQLTYGTAGNGSFQHLAAELFSIQAGIKMVHVPYKGSPQVLTDLLAGRISLSIDNPATVLPRVKTGELRALAVTSGRHWPAAPDLPTMAEAADLPGYEVIISYGVVVPSGTPNDVIAALNAEITRSLKLPDVQARLSNLGAEAAPSTSAEFGDLIRADTLKWGKLVNRIGIKGS